MARKRKSPIALWVRIILLVPLPAIAIWIYLAGQNPRSGLFESAALTGQAMAAPARSLHLPANLPSADFRLADTIQFYNPDNLYVKIDGHDVAFFRFGFVSLTFASYSGRGDDLVDVYVYRMNRRENALGIYAAERSDQRENLDIAEAGYRSGGALFFCRGPFYAQIIPSGPGAEIDAAMAEITDSLSQLIPAPASPLAALEMFPTEGRIVNSDGYFPDNAFGTDFIGEGFTTKYRVGEALITAFRHQSDSADAVFARYQKFLNESSTAEGRIQVDRVEVYQYSDYGESLWILTFENVFAGMTGQFSAAEGKELVGRIITASRGAATD